MVTIKTLYIPDAKQGSSIFHKTSTSIFLQSSRCIRVTRQPYITIKAFNFTSPRCHYIKVIILRSLSFLRFASVNKIERILKQFLSLAQSNHSWLAFIQLKHQPCLPTSKACPLSCFNTRATREMCSMANLNMTRDMGVLLI